jgi:hypothetical protein
VPRTFKLKNIQSDEAICKDYIDLIPTGLPFIDAIRVAHDLCPELRTFCYGNQDKFNGLGARDKGSMGKMVEFYLFGQMPDTDPNPDLSWGADIKGTHFKILKRGYNAKERLTITNCGDRNDYSTFEALVSTPDVRSCKYYPKIRRAVLCVFEHRGGKYDGLDENLSKKLLCCFAYDLEEMPEEITAQIDADFNHIQSTIRAGAITQAGQVFLHTAPHGSGHGSGTRALGFKNKFVTKLVSIYSGKPITVKGSSWFIEKRHFQ